MVLELYKNWEKIYEIYLKIIVYSFFAIIMVNRNIHWRITATLFVNCVPLK